MVLAALKVSPLLTMAPNHALARAPLSTSEESSHHGPEYMSSTGRHDRRAHSKCGGDMLCQFEEMEQCAHTVYVTTHTRSRWLRVEEIVFSVVDSLVNCSKANAFTEA